MGRKLRALTRTIRRRTGEAEAEVWALTEHTRRGARGLIVPASTRWGAQGKDALPPDTFAELTRLGI